ncbi:MAG TPA: phosphoribosyltransferase [Acidimicrobiales bacterium]|nr:phosphoribosyltransferase [Acidimicrobiales bacterium]
MEASAAPDRETLTWAEFGDASRDLARQVADSGFRPDLVLAIARGGLAVAGALAYALSVKNCFAMNVEFYTGVDERIDVPVVLPPMLDLVDIAGLRVLVADDVADTGMTLQLVHSVIAEHVSETRCAVLYEKSRSVIHCEYVFRRTDLWINFPWSTKDPVVSPPRRQAQRV